MKTVDKAMHLLRQFSLERLEIGLNDLARMSGEDKAVTRRLLIALMKHNYIEQSPETRKYRLGPGFLSLARLREATVPMVRATQIAAQWLCAKSNETVHVGIPGGSGMTTASFVLPRRGNVINLRPADSYPYHASASGLAFLAYCSQETRETLLRLKREKMTRFTLTSRDELETFFKDTRAQGYSFSRNTVEEGVSSIAMPFFADGSDPAGTISIAVPDLNLTPDLRLQLADWLGTAVDMLEIALTGGVSDKRHLQEPRCDNRTASAKNLAESSFSESSEGKTHAVSCPSGAMIGK